MGRTILVQETPGRYSVPFEPKRMIFTVWTVAYAFYSGLRLVIQ